MPSKEVSELNASNAAIAKRLYTVARDPHVGADDWQEALRQARVIIADALRASNYMRDPRAALEASGIHMMAFRHMLAPPVSQDQFSLLCEGWIKGSEQSNRRLSPLLAEKSAHTILKWLDRAAVPWLAHNREPRRAEVRGALLRASILIAAQKVQTIQRGRLAYTQESAVIERLIKLGWTRLPSSAIDHRAALEARTFMHKTRFATRTTTPQEVDIACGLGGTVVAAIECKVTNDQTNSVKRINDVLKKATAWQHHWGSFVETVALLQGVIAGKDVDRLSDANVHIFWSHDLDEFERWLLLRVTP